MWTDRASEWLLFTEATSGKFAIDYGDGVLKRSDVFVSHQLKNSSCCVEY